MKCKHPGCGSYAMKNDGVDTAMEKQKVEPAGNPVRCWPTVSDTNTSRSSAGGYVDIITHRLENDKEIHDFGV